MADLKFEEESYRIRGAVFEVYREMGCGFLEAVYQECLEREFAKNGIPFVAKQELVLQYKGDRLTQTYFEQKIQATLARLWGEPAV